MLDSMDYYQDQVDGRENEANPIPTGFCNIDTQIEGLSERLYCLAAIPGMGKTAFALQLADQISAAGHTVLFFSLEQSQRDLYARSITRLAAINNLGDSRDSLRVESGMIRRGQISPEIQLAKDIYRKTISKNMYIIKRPNSMDIDKIFTYVEQFVREMGKRPVVFVDYLQTLAHLNTRAATTKEAVDQTMNKLKNMSETNRIPVFVLSSVNRNSYLLPLDLDSMKESGDIEFVCDVILGLQYSCLSEPVSTSSRDYYLSARRQQVQRERARDPRAVDLVILKSRETAVGDPCSFDYYPEQHLFLPRRNPIATHHDQAPGRFSQDRTTHSSHMRKTGRKLIQ